MHHRARRRTRLKLVALARVAVFVTFACLRANTCLGHHLDYTLATAKFDREGGGELSLSFHVASYVFGFEPRTLSEDEREEVRRMSDQQVADKLAAVGRRLTEDVNLQFGDRVVSGEISLPTVEALREDALAEEPRPSPPVVFEFQAAPDDGMFRLTLAPVFGKVMLELAANGAPPTVQILRPGESSWPFPWRSGMASSTDAGRPSLPAWLVVLLSYLQLGFEHIVPLGPDHILFVLGLFLLSPEWRPLLVQITAFTVAHSVTLALSIFNVVTLPASVVEPAIAASIAFVAIENIFTQKLHWWRTGVVFAFGLLHGLGFAGVLRELGLPQDRVVVALLGFNLGVELGQLAVVALALATIGCFRHRSWYRQVVVIPGSIVIAFVGIYWFVQRL